MDSKLPTTLLCEHEISKAQRKGDRLICRDCDSFWDLSSFAHTVTYNADYAQNRHHFDESVGKQKIKTLTYWLERAHISVKDSTICEVGFGGGHCLSKLNHEAKNCYGLETSLASIEHASGLGIPRQNLFAVENLPPRLPSLVDLWIFQDSFEHILEPIPFTQWMQENSSERCQIFLVAPSASSLSQKILGRLWPHRLVDHQFHWSQKGLEEFFLKRGFERRIHFFPLKFVSLTTLVDHLGHKFGVKMPGLGPLGSISIPFNIGEMGLVLCQR